MTGVAVQRDISIFIGGVRSIRSDFRPHPQYFAGGSIHAHELPLQFGQIARRFHVQSVAGVARHVGMVTEDDRA